jgi:hypothetical protein
MFSLIHREQKMNAFVSPAAVSAELTAPYNHFQIWRGDSGGRYVFSKAFDASDEDFSGAVVILASKSDGERLLWAGDGAVFMKMRRRDPQLVSSVDVYVHWLTTCPLSRRKIALELYSLAA